MIPDKVVGMIVTKFQEAKKTPEGQAEFGKQLFALLGPISGLKMLNELIKADKQA